MRFANPTWPAVGQLLLQRDLWIRNTYIFDVGWGGVKQLLRPMDLITITDAKLGLNKKLCRINTIVKHGISGGSDSSQTAEYITIEAEECPIG